MPLLPVEGWPLLHSMLARMRTLMLLPPCGYAGFQYSRACLAPVVVFGSAPRR